MLGFIVYATDTNYLPTKHDNWGNNIKELLNINEHNLSIIGEILSVIGKSLIGTWFLSIIFET